MRRRLDNSTKVVRAHNKSRLDEVWQLEACSRGKRGGTERLTAASCNLWHRSEADIQYYKIRHSNDNASGAAVAALFL
jgi:hypothetical protein